MKHWIIVTLLAASSAVAQSDRAERFDTSGMPRRPTTFLEQQIFEMIATHTRGDLTEAARIQRKLGRYYSDKGDEKRANAAFLAAAEAEKPPEAKQDRTVAPEPHPQPPAAPSPAREPEPPKAQARSAFSGNFYGMDGRTLHTWEFNENGNFLHTWIASGAGTSVRNSERGTFRVVGDSIELTNGSSASAFATPGVGGRGTVVGGGSDADSSVRRLKFTKGEGGIVLDGVKLKPKSW